MRKDSAREATFKTNATSDARQVASVLISRREAVKILSRIVIAVAGVSFVAHC